MAPWNRRLRGLTLSAALLGLGGCPPAEPPTGLDPAVALETIEGHRAVLESCHEGDDEVRLEVRIVVSAAGEVSDVRARGSARHGPCVEAAIREWSFPSSPAETEIDVPIVFAAAE